MDSNVRLQQIYGVCFFFNDTATTEIYTFSLHDALPIWGVVEGTAGLDPDRQFCGHRPVLYHRVFGRADIPEIGRAHV